MRELLLAGRRKVREVSVATSDDGDEDPRTSGPTRRRAVSDGSLEELAELALDLGVPVREVSRRRLAALARTEAPQGVVARAAPLPEADLDDLAASGAVAPFLVAADGVTDPGNLGALLRSAECAGATGAVLPRHRAVHITPTVAKAAAGAIEYLPIAVVGGLPTAIRTLQDRGVLVVGLDAAGTQPVFALPLDADQAVCVVAGAEGHGLSRLVRDRCDLVVAIPQLGHLASLNVATAATVACYEVARCRLPQ